MAQTDSQETEAKGRLQRLRDSDIWASFTSSWVVVGAAIMTVFFFFIAIFAPLVAPHNPFDLASIDILDASLPPVWLAEGDSRFLLGTDDQGRDVFSTIIYGARISLFVGFASVIFSMVLGVGLGLISGYVGGRLDDFIMRVADVQLSFPAILIALLIDGVARGIFPRDMHEDMAFYVLIFAIGVSGWVQYARTVRGSTLVEKNKEYVQAARVIGLGPGVIL
ncbi:MAG: ABC transporter permease, partial [Pseudomonadota bacterium]